MKRYDILDNDTTTRNGRVKATCKTDTIHGIATAHENDPVWCPGCESWGKIVCVGPRIDSKGPDGRQQALSDDLCLCKCTPNPHLVASQMRSFCEV